MADPLGPPPSPLQTMQYPAFAYSLYERPDGSTLAYKILGSRNHARGRPLVLIHGLSAVGLVDWNPLAEALAESRPVLIFDNRGVGGSVQPKQLQSVDYTVQDLSDDVVDLVRRIGWKEIDLLGFSMGGMIAQTLLCTPSLPFRIAHVVLAATSAKAAHSDLLSAIPNPGTMEGGGIEGKMKLVKPFVEIGYDPEFVKDPKNAPLLRRRLEESVFTRRPARTMTKQLAVIANYDVRPRLAQAVPKTLPVLIIHGKLDRSVFFSERRYILDRIPHATIAILPRDDIGHAWYDYFGTPFWVNLLSNFLNDQPATSVFQIPRAKL